MEDNNKDIRDKYMEQHKYYMSLYQKKFKKLRKDTNKYFNIYFYGINYYWNKLKDEPTGSDTYY